MCLCLPFLPLDSAIKKPHNGGMSLTGGLLAYFIFLLLAFLLVMSVVFYGLAKEFIADCIKANRDFSNRQKSQNYSKCLRKEHSAMQHKG